MFGDDAVTDGKPKPHAFPDGARREEWLKYFAQILSRNACAIVADNDMRLWRNIFSEAGADGNLLCAHVLLYRLLGIQQNIQQSALQLLIIGFQRGQWMVFAAEVNALVFICATAPS